MLACLVAHLHMTLSSPGCTTSKAKACACWSGATQGVQHHVSATTGFPEHEVEVNAAKTRLSFDVVIGGVALPRNEYVTPDETRFIKWCGLLVNAATLNVQVSFHSPLPCKLDDNCQLCKQQQARQGFLSFQCAATSMFASAVKLSGPALMTESGWFSHVNIGGPCLRLTVHFAGQADYTRYEGMHLWQTMTGAARRPGQLLKRRLAGFLRPKCHPVLLDTVLNSRTTVRLNIYQVPPCIPGRDELSHDMCTIQHCIIYWRSAGCYLGRCLLCTGCIPMTPLKSPRLQTLRRLLCWRP